jgi:tripartite-type tricarboxylate transporter receptor subunit TctC
MRRSAIAYAAFLAALACAPALVQAYPAKAIRMIMPFAPGGVLEAQARVVTVSHP